MLATELLYRPFSLNELKSQVAKDKLDTIIGGIFEMNIDDFEYLEENELLKEFSLKLTGTTLLEDVDYTIFKQVFDTLYIAASGDIRNIIK